MIDIEKNYNEAKIMVIGCGGGGNNTVNKMVEDGFNKGVTFVGVNTDIQALGTIKADKAVAIGQRKTKGLGAGARPEVGEAAAVESIDDINDLLKGIDMVFVTCGMGGGTGTGSAPVIAKAAHDKGILTVGVVTKPFKFEGKQRMKNAEEGIAKLRENVDTLIIVSNDKLIKLCDRRCSFENALHMADSVLSDSVTAITSLIMDASLINLDFSDVCTTMRNQGDAHIGIGVASGENKAVEAAKRALASPLLESEVVSANNIILNVSGDISLFDASEAAEYVQGVVGEDANIIFGTSYSSDAVDTVKVTLVATGINQLVEPKISEYERFEMLQNSEPATSFTAPQVQEIHIPEFLRR